MKPILTENRVACMNLTVMINAEINNAILLYVAPEIKDVKDLVPDKNELEYAKKGYEKRWYDCEKLTSEEFNQEAKTVLDEVIVQMSFLGSFRCVLSHKEKFDKNFIDCIKKNITSSIPTINDIRGNSVHPREVTKNDKEELINFALSLPRDLFPQTTSYANELSQDELSKDANPKKSNLNESLNTNITHNVPYPPSYRDSGFLGRQQDLNKITTKLEGNTRCMTLYGDAGVGKTAIAQKIALDYILNDDYFDLILWYSFKQEKLTTKGIEEIKGLTSIIDIRDRENLPDIEMDDDSSCLEEDDFFEWVNSKNTLIILDNLETLQEGESFQDTNEFLDDIQDYAKVLITSRSIMGISIGSRIPIKKFQMKDCLSLVKKITHHKNIEKLQNVDEERLIEWIEKLQKNPLWIKSFCDLVNNNEDPYVIINKFLIGKGNFGDYAFNANYKKLGERSKYILAILYNTLTDSLSRVEISRVYEKIRKDNLQNNDLRKILQTLSDQNFLDWNKHNQGKYELQETARYWLKGNAHIGVKDKFVMVSRAMGEVRQSIADVRKYQKLPVCHHEHFHTDNKNQEIIIDQLKECTKALKRFTHAINNKIQIGREAKATFERSTNDGKGLIFKLIQEDSTYHGQLFVSNTRFLEPQKLKRGDPVKVIATDYNKNKKLYYLKDCKQTNMITKQEVFSNAIDRAEEIKENFGEDYFEIERVLGLLKSMSGMEELKREAYDHFTKAIELAPSQAKCYYNMALYMRREFNTGHEEFLSKAYELAPNEDVIIDAYSRTLLPNKAIPLVNDKIKASSTYRSKLLLLQSLYRILSKHLRYDAIPNELNDSIKLTKDSLIEYSNDLNSNHFDKKSIIYYLITLVEYLLLIKDSKKYDNFKTEELEIFFQCFEKIELDMRSNIEFMLIYLDIIDMNFPAYHERYIKTEHVQHNIRAYLLDREHAIIDSIQFDPNNSELQVSLKLKNNEQHYYTADLSEKNMVVSGAGREPKDFSGNPSYKIGYTLRYTKIGHKADKINTVF